jgi:very-short-patch-repair endonuclease
MTNYGNRELMSRAREQRNNMTPAEVILWTKLRSRKIDGYKFRRQQPVFDYIVDFYCHKLKLIVEVDGEIHSLPENIKYDIRRDRILKINGYHIIRLSNFEIESNITTAINKIKSFINANMSPCQGDNRGSIT